MATFPPPAAPLTSGQRLNTSAALVRRGFVAYARWLDSISWRRFFLLSLLALISAGVLSGLPPFSIEWGGDPAEARPGKPPKVPPPPKTGADGQGHRRQTLVIGGQTYEIVIDGKRVFIGPAAANAASASASAGASAGASDGASAGSSAGTPAGASGAAPSAAGAASTASASPSITINLGDRVDSEQIREAIDKAAAAIDEPADDEPRSRRRSGLRLGDHLPPFTFLLIVLSIVTKIMAAGRFKAEAQAVVATEMAESEALKRQVVEARMAAMQAQVEPHFLFNTLASIDHLIETDPPRASKMQRNLIALLRASMPSMREANAQGTRDLGRELAVIRPFLEILKVRMEERLVTDVRVSDGLLSAEFPPMMLQGLVENAIKHGLEPKAEGGRLSVSAEIVHGKLAVTVADTGVGFAESQRTAATAGTGIGLNNIRERLHLLYGGKAQLTVSDTPGGGTTATITVPYATRDWARDAARDAGTGV